MLRRRDPQQPAPPSADQLERARLAAAVDQALAIADQAMRTHAANRPLVDLALDIRQALRGQP